MMASTRATGVAVFAVLLAALTGCSAQSMKIYPLGDVQSLALGKSKVLTCIVDAPDPGLITLPMWRDPKGNIINEISLVTHPDVYTQPEPTKQAQLLYVMNATPSMAGTYTCIASYANQPIIKNVTLQTYVAITWTNANDNQFATKGSDYKVMCEITAEPPPSVNWMKGNSAIETGHRYVIHTNGLLIKNVQESDDGTYTCRASVSETGELASKSIKLEVFTAPTMLEMEREVMLKEGEGGMIKCQAQGTEPIKYTWIKASTRENLAMTSRYSVNERTGVLTFEKVAAGDYGTYICSAANKAGQNETAIEVEVLVTPKIFELNNKTYSEGTDASLECKATGRPAPMIIFRKLSNEDPYVEGLNDNGRITVDIMKRLTGDQMLSTGILSINRDLMRSDDGLYECIARSPVPNGGEARKNGHLTVQFKPSFENMPRVPVWSWNGQPVNISCLAESIPNATIKWRFHDYDLYGNPRIKIYGSGPYSYITITPSDRTMFGYYKCVATNPLGEAEHTIELREAFPPGPVPQADVKQITATTVEFEIVSPAEEMGPPIVAITTQYKETTNNDWNYAKNKTWSANSNYVIEDLMPMTNYNFRFAAVNQVGLGSWGIVKLVRMPKRAAPEAPLWRENISSEDLIQSKYSDRYELRWRIPAHNGEPIDMYQIDICPVINVSGEWRVTQGQCENRQLKTYDVANYEVTGLIPDSRYRLSLSAHNVLGFSMPIHLLVQTAPGVIGNDSDNFGNDESVGGGGGRSPQLSSGALIGLALAGVLLCLVIVDLILFCWKRVGVAASLCSRRVTTHQDNESKLGRDEKEPLRELGGDIMKRNSSVEFDGHRAFATSGGSIIGKNSAV